MAAGIAETMEYALMILATLVVIAAMLLTLRWFFTRLHSIEELSWEPRDRAPLRSRIKDTLYRIRHRATRG